VGNRKTERVLPVLIDTDAGIDDALALVFALRSPELSVRTITTVAGNVEVGHCTRNVLHVLSLVHPPLVPNVVQGAARPLRRRLTVAKEVHGRTGLGLVSASPSISKKLGSDAPRAVAEFCTRFRSRGTIVAIGPLTNIAAAWRKYPRALKSLGRLISMGGAFRVPGNTGPVAEFNYFVDPEAAHVVMHSGLPLTVIPLDVTQQLVMMESEVLRRTRSSNTPLHRFLRRSTKFYMDYHWKAEGFRGGYLHDPLAIAAAIDPSIVRTELMNVLIETEGHLTRGMTIGEKGRGQAAVKRAKSPKRTRGVRVATRVDRERFLDLFHDRLWDK